MPYFGVNEIVRIQVEGRTIVGKLVDINMRRRQYKVKTEDGYLWITQKQIVDKLE